MSHEITVDYLKLALARIEEGAGPFKRDPLAFAESVIEAQKRIAHDALNGEWDPPAVELDVAPAPAKVIDLMAALKESLGKEQSR